MNISVMTYDVNYFRGKDTEYNQRYCSERSFQAIMEQIHLFLESEENPVVFLQAVPFKNNEIWEKIKAEFVEYEILYPHNLNNLNAPLTATVAIIKKGGFYNQQTFKQQSLAYNNRIIALETTMENVILLGVDMPNAYKKNIKPVQEVWDDLKASVKREAQRPIILAGNFTANIPCNEKRTETHFKTLMACGMVDLVPPQLPTFIGGTTIDHILINSQAQARHEFIYEQDIKNSSHRWLKARFAF